MIVFITRGVRHGGAVGQFEVSRIRLDSTDIIKVRSQSGFVEYQPIAAITYSGSVRNDELSSGHYFADVMTPDGNWYRANDSAYPFQIPEDKVTPLSTMHLYKKL